MLCLISDLLGKSCGQKLVLLFKEFDLGLSLLSLLLEVAALVSQSIVLALGIKILLNQIAQLLL